MKNLWNLNFLDINISVQDNSLATSFHYPTSSHSPLLYSSSHNLMSKTHFHIPYFSGSVDFAAMIQT